MGLLADTPTPVAEEVLALVIDGLLLTQLGQICFFCVNTSKYAFSEVSQIYLSCAAIITRLWINIIL